MAQARMHGSSRCTDTGECQATDKRCVCNARCAADDAPSAVRCCADVTGPTCNNFVWVGTFADETCVPCPIGTYDHDTDAGNVCEPCPRSTYQDAAGTTACTPCPSGTVSGLGSKSLSDCTAQPLYVGCFDDRESFVDGRDLSGARFTMGSAASVQADLCAGWVYMGLQSIDQCYCDNDFGSYGQLDLELDEDEDTVCGTGGDACGQNNTAYQVTRAR